MSVFFVILQTNWNKQANGTSLKRWKYEPTKLQNNEKDIFSYCHIGIRQFATERAVVERHRFREIPELFLQLVWFGLDTTNGSRRMGMLYGRGGCPSSDTGHGTELDLAIHD